MGPAGRYVERVDNAVRVVWPSFYLCGGYRMNIQIFGICKCFNTKKAERWFKERRIKFQAVAVKKSGISLGELTSVKKAVGLAGMVYT